MTRAFNPGLPRRLGAALLVAGSLAAGPALAQAPAAKTKPTAPQRTETVVYDNWTVTCHDSLADNARRTCSASLQVTNRKNGQSVLIWEIGTDSAGKPTYAVRTPLGVRVKEGIRMTVGAAKPRQVDYVLCDTRGCEAAAPFDDALARDLKAASEASIAFTATNGQTFTIKVPLKGISQALAAMRG
ncbi:invasion associated locus B family protein [Pseudoxanthobacter sp.]|uniref:invasion associated locus B family protein n=1 Tax=Pseudoxanthobacter sp. TaxID=1925742 RepID=UPI002FE2851F